MKFREGLYEHVKPEDAGAKYEAFLPKVREFASGSLDQVSLEKLNSLIDELTPIPVTQVSGNNRIYDTLINLRIALFRPELRGHLNQDETAENLFAQLKDEVK